MNDGVVVEYCLSCTLPHCTAGWGSKNEERRWSEISEELWGVCTFTFNVQLLYGRGFQIRCNMRMAFLLIQCVSRRTCCFIQIPKTLGWVTVLMPKPHNIALSSFNQILFVLPSSLPLPFSKWHCRLEGHMRERVRWRRWLKCWNNRWELKL